MTRAMPAMWLDLLSMYPYPSKCILNHWSGFNMASRRWRPWLLPSPSSASWKWKKSQETLRRFVHQNPAPFFPQWMKGLSERNERRHFLWAQLRCHTQVAWRWSPLLPKRRSSSPKQPSSQKHARAVSVDEFRWLFVAMLLAVLNSTQLRLADSSPTCNFDGNLIKLILGRCEFCSPFCSSFKMTGMPNKSHGKSMNGSTSQR